MSYGTVTRTSTYTKVDIRRVFEAVEATLRMAVTRTGLNSPDWAVNVGHDLRLMAENGVLSRAHLVRHDAMGQEVRALVFTPTDAAQGWVDERPKANHWPLLPSGRLGIVVELTSAYHALSPAQQAASMSGCLLGWGTTSIDTTHAGLQFVRSQNHASNGYGVQTLDYSR